MLEFVSGYTRILAWLHLLDFEPVVRACRRRAPIFIRPELDILARSALQVAEKTCLVAPVAIWALRP